MNLIRKYKISKNLNIPLTGIEKEIVDFIESKLKNLDTYIYPKYPNNTFLMTPQGKWLIEIDPDMDAAYIRYDDFSLILEEKYGIELSDIESFMSFLISYKFNFLVNFIASFGETDYTEIENFYKNSKKS